MTKRSMTAVEQHLNNRDAVAKAVSRVAKTVSRQMELARVVGNPATVRADAAVTAKPVGYPATAAVTATLDVVCVVSAAPTAKGRARQLAELLTDLRALPDPWGSSMAQKWGPFLEVTIKKLHNAGTSPSPERAKAFRLFDRAEREGRLEDRETWLRAKRVIRDHVKTTPRQVDRWFEQWKLGRGLN